MSDVTEIDFFSDDELVEDAYSASPTNPRGSSWVSAN